MWRRMGNLLFGNLIRRAIRPGSVKSFIFGERESVASVTTRSITQPECAFATCRSGSRSSWPYDSRAIGVPRASPQFCRQSPLAVIDSRRPHTFGATLAYTSESNGGSDVGTIDPDRNSDHIRDHHPRALSDQFASRRGSAQANPPSDRDHHRHIVIGAIFWGRFLRSWHRRSAAFGLGGPGGIARAN